MRPQTVEPVRVGCGPLAVFQAVSQDHVHQPERERRVGARVRRKVPVREPRRARLIRVNDDQPRPGAPRLLNLRPQVNIIAVDVRAPGQDQPRVMEVLGVGAQFAAVDREQRLAARGRADGAVQLRRTQPVKKAPVHGAVAERPDGARVRVRQHRFRPMLPRDLTEPPRDCVERFVPAHALKRLGLLARPQRAFGRTGTPPQWMEHPVRRVHVVQILGDLGAQKAARDRVLRVAGKVGRPA